LCYVGRISYGLYLYHWLIFLVLDHHHTGLAGSALVAARLLATFAVAVASFHLVEQPVRTRRFPRRLQLGIGLPFGAVATSALVVATSFPAAATAPPATAAAGSALSATTTAPRSNGITSGAASPVHVLLVGDSMGMTLGWGLAAGAEAWGVTITNQGMIGCDLDPSSIVNIEGSVSPAAQGCADWQSHWAAQIVRLQPDVVAIALGRWEVSDRMIDGRWTRIGEPAWDRRLEALLSQAVDIASSNGAKVALFTLPYIQQNTEQPNGRPWDINLPARTDAFNAVLRRVASHHTGTAAIVDINRLLDPNGHYTSLIDGIRVRNSDEEHPSVLGGEFVRPAVLPQLVGLAFWRGQGPRA